MNVNYGIGSKFKIDDSDLARVERRFQSMIRTGQQAAISLGNAFVKAFRSPGVRAAFDDMERRLRRLDDIAARVGTGTTRSARPDMSWARGFKREGERYLDQLRLERNQRQARFAQQDREIRLASIIPEEPKAPRTPAPRMPSLGGMTSMGGMASRLAGVAGMAAGGPIGAIAATVGMAVAQAAGMALYNGTVGAVQTFTEALMTAATTLRTLHMQAESAMVAIQANYMVIDGATPANARGAALGTYRRLERAAAVGPGETQDYVDAFHRIYAQGRRRGASVEQIEKLASMAVAAGTGFPGGARFAAMDVYQALTSGLSGQHTPHAIRALENVGVTPDQFRAATPQEQMDMLIRGYGSYEKAVAEFAKTVGAQEDTFADNMKRMVRTMTPEVYETYRRLLADFNVELQGVNDKMGHGGLVDSVTVLTAAMSKMADDVMRGFGRGFSETSGELERAVNSLAYSLGVASQAGEGLASTFGRIVGSAAGKIATGASVYATALSNYAGGSPTSTKWGDAPIVGGFAPRVFGAIYDALYGQPSMMLIPPREQEQNLVSGVKDGVGEALEDALARNRRAAKIDVNVVWGDSRTLAIPLRQAVHHGMALAGLAPVGSPESMMFQGG